MDKKQEFEERKEFAFPMETTQQVTEAVSASAESSGVTMEESIPASA